MQWTWQLDILTFSLIVKTFYRDFLTFHLTVNRTPYTYSVVLDYTIRIFLRYLKIKLCKHNQKEVESVHYRKDYAKGLLRNYFVYVETFRLSKSLFCQKEVHLKYIQDILLLHIVWFLYHYTQCLRPLFLVPTKIDFVLSWPKCLLNLLLIKQSLKVEKFPSTCF